MLRKRLIFTLIYNQGSFMQSRNFRLQKVGDVAWLEKNYQFQKIAFSLDELIVLNASRDAKSMVEFSQAVSQLTQDVFIPIAAGGGIRAMEDAELLFKSGADKIVLNSLLFNDVQLVEKLVKQYGSQSIVASVDYKKTNGINEVFIEDGVTKLDLSLEDYIQHVENLNVGEVYLNSIDQDGTGFGYDLETINQIKKAIKAPLIIAGGAGNERHLLDGLNIDKVSAVATANLFNFMGNALPNARKDIIQSGVSLAPWKLMQEEVSC